MRIPETTNTAERTRGAQSSCCCDKDGCEAGLRNNYFQGKVLTADTFRVEQRYLVERRRLLNRAIHGWGVVYGYAIEAAARATLCIDAGLALDACGRELLQVGSKRIGLDQLLILDDNGRPAVDDDGKRLTFRTAFTANPRACWLLRAHYAELSTDPVCVTDSCRCPHDEWDHTCETVRYTLTKVLCGDCCAPDECGFGCDCGCHPCCDSEDEDTGPEAPLRKPRPPSRGGCACLCEHLTGLQPGAGCECPLEPFDDPCAEGRLSVDLRHGVPLACLQVAFERECADWTITRVDGCGPRRLVKRNDLLFDLIRGCDLTRISEIGWRAWHRREDPPLVPYDEFSQAFGPLGHDQPTYMTEAFWVRFSRPVRKSSLRPDCFAITVFSTDREGGWWQGARVPIVGLVFLDAKDEGLVLAARVVVDGPWVEDGLRGTKTLFKGEENLVEIEVRGDFIVDCNGQTVDANAIGRATNRTGNGVPGGTFRSGFRVGPAPDKHFVRPIPPVRNNEGEQS